MKKAALFPFLAMACLGTAVAEGARPSHSGWTIVAAPTFTLPMTAGDFGANVLFSPAWGASLSAENAISSTLPLSLRLDACYSIGGLLPSQGFEVKASLNEASLMAGAVYGLPLGDALSLRGFAGGGMAYGSLGGGASSVYGVARAGGGLAISFGDFDARLEAAWVHKLGLYGALAATLGLGWRIPAAPAPAGRLRLLEFASLDMKSVFPILRSYYDEHPLGIARIVNTGKAAACDIRVSFIIRQYMDAPKECATIKRLEPGKSVEVNLYGLFNDRILTVTEATKVSAEVTVEYGDGSANGNLDSGTLAKTLTATVYDRNALTWADDRKAAAFVSSKDPWVLDLAGNIVAAVKSRMNPELAKNMQTAIAIHEGLRAFGLGYMPSPNRPFAQAVVDPEIVDSLKFPRQTLSYRSGDCADLSVLYASFFEAVGIETAFVTLPGHIFMAADLGLRPSDLATRSMDAGEFIVRGDRVWLPIETTMRDAGFLDAWKKAAGEWRDAVAKNKAAIFPIHEAWNLYAPVGLPDDGSAIASPPQDVLARAFGAELAKAVDAELGARVSAMGSGQSKGQASPKSQNDLGVLYAKYGKYAEAEKRFQAAAKQGFVASIVNLGNLAYLKSDMAGALAFYQQASKLSPNNAQILVSLAKAAAALGKADVVRTTLAAMRALDPAAAERYAGLAQANNASEAAGTRAAAQEEGGPAWF